MAFGKIILFGEHAVVYGEPAIGFPISRAAHVTIRPGKGKVRIETNTPFEPSRRATPPADLVARALQDDLLEFDVSIELDFAPMSGLGSSAAIAVALLRAVSPKTIGRRALLESALRIEEAAHAKPSGVDPAISIWSQPIRFVRQNKRMTIRRLAIHKPTYFVVGIAGQHGGTAGVVSRVAEIRSENRTLVRSAMATLGEATKAGATGLSRGTLEPVGRAMDLAHGTLSGLGLVAPGVEQAVLTARSAGAWGAKMSGAGGAGGAFVALASSKRRATTIESALVSEGFDCWIERITTGRSRG